MRKLLSVALMALGLGLGVAERPAQAASYAGGASTRCCPVPQECGGHVRVSTPASDGAPERVQETVYETQQVPCVRDVCETVMQPRTITDDADGRRAARPRRGPTRSSGRCYRTVMREVPLHGPAAGHADDLEGRGLHGLPARCARRTCETKSYTVSRPVRETTSRRASTTSCRPVRETSYKDVHLHGLPAGAGDGHQDRAVHGLPPGAGDLLQDLLLHGLPAGPEDLLPAGPLHGPGAGADAR